MTEEWRPAVAALNDPIRRAVYASIVLGVEAPVKKRDRALARLVDAGLIVPTDTGHAVVDDPFARLLALEPSITKTGVDRFIVDGRIDRYPARPADRAELLGWASDRVLTQDERVSEAVLGERRSEIVDDVATLRRYLVDAGLLHRDADGREYWR
jgi:hypothetical protein